MKADQLALFPLGSCVHILSRGVVHVCNVCLTVWFFVDKIYKQFKSGSDHALCYDPQLFWHFFRLFSEIIFVKTHPTTEYYLKKCPMCKNWSTKSLVFCFFLGCGNDVNVFPKHPVLVTSPGYSTHKVLKTGVICTWHLNTDAVHVLQIHVSRMDLHNNTENHMNQHTSCDQTQTFVNVSNVGLFCTAEAVGRNATTAKSSLKITLMTGLRAGGTGFLIHVKTFGE